MPNTFNNKESIAHKESLHNLLEKVYSLYSIVEGGGLLITFPHYPLAEKIQQKTQTRLDNSNEFSHEYQSFYVLFMLRLVVGLGPGGLDSWNPRK